MSWGARTQIELGDSASLTFRIEDWGGGVAEQGLDMAVFSHLGGTVKFEVDHRVDTGTMPFTIYELVRITVQSGADIHSKDIDFRSWQGTPPVAVWNGLPMEFACTWTVTGLYLRSKHTATPGRSDAAAVHSTECTLEERWFADTDTSVSVNCDGLIASGNLSYSDEEVDLGTNPFRFLFAVYPYRPSAAYDIVTLDTITHCGIPVGAGQCDQTSNVAWLAGRGWGTNDGGDYTAAGSGSSIVIRSNASALENSWYGWSDVPRAVNFAGVSVRRFVDGLYDDDTGPLIHTGCTDFDGNELVEEAGALPGYGTIASKDVCSWVAQNASEAPPYPEWSGYTVPATMRLYLDTDWLKDHSEYHTDGTYNDTYMTLECHALSFTNRTDSPLLNGIWQLAHVASLNVNDPPVTTVRTDASRPSLWEGTGGVTVSATPAQNDLWVVAADATAPVVSRDLVSIYFDRLDAVKAGTAGDYAAPGFPECYLYDKANMDPKYPTEVVQTEEDVCSWMRYAFLRVGLNAPEVTFPAILTLTVYWYDVIVTDCHLSGSARVDGFGYSRTARAASYSFTVSASGSQYVDLDLLSTPTEQESVSLRHVYKLEFSGFPCEAGTWELETLELRQHATDSFRYAKFVEPWTYTGVGWSMVVDGKVSALAMPDDYRENAEDGLEILNWLFGAETGTDLTTPLTLTQLRNILDNQEGLTCTLDTSEWQAHFVDADAVELCDDYPWLCSEDEDRDEAHPTANWDWPISVRVNQIAIPRGIVYRIQTVKILQCGGHGVAWVGTTRYTDEDEVTVYVWRRQPGTAVWEQVGTCGPNALGYYTEGGLQVLMTQGETPPEGDVKWEYGVSLDGTGEDVASLGSGFNREWLWQRTSGTTIYYPNICRDAEGQIWRVAADLAGRLYVAYLGANAAAWSDVAQPFGGAVGYSWPSIAAFGDGSIVVAATSSGDMRLARTRDRGTTWTELTMATLGEGLEYGDIAQRNGKLWLCGWDNEKVYLAMSSNPDLTREEIMDGTYLLEVGDAPSGDIIPRSSIVQVDDASIIVVIGQIDGTMETYQLRDPNTGFVEIT